MESLYCAGSNSHGQLGINSLEDTSTFQLSNLNGPIQDLVFGGNHTLALMRDSKLFGCGSNFKGQLGPGDSSNRLEFERIELQGILAGLEGEKFKEMDFEIDGIAAMWETSFILLKRKNGGSDLLLSFGGNDWGERGNETNLNSLVHLVDFSHLLPTPESILSILRIVAGPRHIIALIQIDNEIIQLVGWGASRHRQLGSFSNRTSPPRIISIPTSINLPTPLDFNKNIQFSLGRDHTVILSDRKLITIGSNKQSQLGSNEGVIGTSKENEQIESVQCNWTGTFLLYPNCIYGFGSNTHNQLAQSNLLSSLSFLPISLPLDSKPIKLSCGSEHSLALIEMEGDKVIVAWGWNEHGNLGNGNKTDVVIPELINLPRNNQYELLNIWGGNATSWISIVEKK